MNWLRRLLRLAPKGQAGAKIVTVCGPGLVNYRAALRSQGDDS